MHSLIVRALQRMWSWQWVVGGGGVETKGCGRLGAGTEGCGWSRRRVVGGRDEGLWAIGS